MKNETSSELSECSKIHRRWHIAMAPRIPEKKHQARDAVLVLDELIPKAPGRPIFEIDKYKSIANTSNGFVVPALPASVIPGYIESEWE